MAMQTVQVFPVAKPDEWREFIESASTGEHAEGHRAMLRRLGVNREQVWAQATPAGQIMILVWDGMDPEKVGEHMGDLLQNPQTEHEKYIANYVIPVLHGANLADGPPPGTALVATIET
jgi:hypothetical protein